MHYLVQSNINSEPEYHQIFHHLNDLNLSYETIELNSSISEIVLESDRKDIFIFGSVKLARLAKANKDWTPGSFYGGNHKFEIHSQFYKDNLLNYETTIHKFSEKLTWKPNESKFIKPYQDAKVFTGGIFTEQKWNNFVEHSIQYPKTKMLHENTLVQASQPQRLVKEARLWIIGGSIVASIYYRFHGSIPFEKEVAKEGLNFAQSMIDLYNVTDAFVMDICLTMAGWKIVEVNCINSAGFYHVNIRTLLRAIEAFFND